MIPDVPGYAKERPRWPSEVGPAGALLCRGGQDEGLPGSGGGGGSAVTGWRVSAPVSTVPAAGCRRTALATSSATLAGSAPATCTWMVGDGASAWTRTGSEATGFPLVMTPTLPVRPAPRPGSARTSP